MSDVMCIMTRLWYIHRVWYTAERYRPSGTGRVVGPFVLTLQLYDVLTFSQVSRGSQGSQDPVICTQGG